MKIKNIKCNCSSFCEGLIIFFAFFIIFLSDYLSQNNISEDILWLYHMSLKMLCGYMPYRDINMIVTPFMFQIVEVFMKIFGDGVLLYYVCMSLLGSAFIVTVRMVLKEVSKSKILNLCFMIAFVFLAPIIYIYSYNITTINFIFLAIFFELKKKDNDEKIYDYLVGLMLGFSAASKQTIGGLAIVFSLFYDLYKKFYLKEYEKNGSVLRKLFGILTVAMPYLIWLLLNDSVMSFLDQCIFAIFEFGNKNNGGQIFNLYTLVPITLVVISFLLCFTKKCRSLPGYEKMSILTFYMIPMLFVIVPIANQYHCTLMLIASFPLIAFYINLFFENKLLKIDSASWIVFTMFLGYTLVFVGCFIGKWNYNEINNSIEKYKYIGLNDEQVQDIIDVTEYIKSKEANGYKVYILSPDAGLYMIPLERYDNNKFDLLFKGNLGYDGENRIVEQMKKMKNTVFLKREELFWQESEIIDNYVNENFEVIDEINGYKIYVTNDVVF